MNYNEMMLALESSFSDFDDLMNKAGIYLEAIGREYQLNQKKQLLFTEETDDGEKKEAPSKSFIEKSKKVINKIIDGIVSFIKSVRNKIQNFYTNEKTKTAFEKLEALCKSNSMIGSKVVSFNDPQKKLDLIEKTKNKLGAKFAAAKAGRATEMDLDEIEKIMIEYDKENGKLTTKTDIKIAHLLNRMRVLLERFNKMDKETDTFESKREFTQALADVGNGDIIIKIYSRYLNNMGKLVRDEADLVTNSLDESYRKVRESIGVEKESKEDKEEKIEEESYFDMDSGDLFNQILTEEASKLVPVVESKEEVFNTNDYLNHLVEDISDEMIMNGLNNIFN